MQTINLDWSDLKSRLMSSLDEGKPWGQAQGATLRRMYDRPYERAPWPGGDETPSAADVLGWLRDGYYADALSATLALPAAKPKARAMWSEEDGDVDAGRLYGGYDDFMLTIEPSDSKPGLRLEIDMFFAWMVPSKVLTAYGAWLAGLTSALEQHGYDLTIDLVLPVNNLYQGARGGQNVRIAVKRAGELSDFTEWSAVFSPASTRILMFTAFGVASESIGKRQTDHMASARSSRDWGVDYDSTENVLRITANQVSRKAFPADLMTEKLRDAGLV